MTYTEKRLESDWEKAVDTWSFNENLSHPLTSEKVKIFIRIVEHQAIAEERERVKEEIKKKRKIIFPLDTKPEMNLESITHLAEFNKKSMEYNQTLDDLKPIISNLLK